MTIYRFTDTLTSENIAITCACEDNAWAELCDRFGTGYVFENITLYATETLA